MKTKGIDSITTTTTFVKRKDGMYLWLFNWIGGGFNSSWGFTKEDAIKEGNKMCSLKVDEKSVKQATQESAREQDRMGYLMTC